jgi:DNA polymerase-1
VGIGRKAAAKLLKEFGSLEALMDGLDRIKTPKTREKLEASRERVRQNRKMVELDCDLTLPVPIDDLRIRPDYPRLIESMERYEFKSLLQDVRDEAARAGRAVQGELL